MILPIRILVLARVFTVYRNAVRKWLKGDIDYEELEASYLKSQMLFYKTNALAFGTTHLHGFTEKKYMQ